MPLLRLCLVLHNHQPVGNFDGVFEQAYRDSYQPFLDVFETYDFPLALHTSGPLMEWLDERHPEYVDRLARLVAAGRLEIVGGPFYEPILTMLPRRDRVGQIRAYAAWLQKRLGAEVTGMWMPERVWEQSLASDLVAAGMQYTVLDDYHFKNAGLTDDQLDAAWLTEDDGRTLAIFPGSEKLRYTIPFQAPQATIDHLRQVAERRPGGVVVFGDDGEKFGVWPETKQHVYERGWLRQFFDLLAAQRDWLRITTPSEALRACPLEGKIYLPDASYREMTEWALPVGQQIEYDHLVHELAGDSRWPRIQRFFQGGFWRNFKVKYPEANEMYARMLQVSRRLEQAEQTPVQSNGEAVQSNGDAAAAEALDEARRALYRGQCNCPYWHGAFGGIYLPHLRNAIYGQLIAADNLLDQQQGKTAPYAEIAVADYNFDARQEVLLASDRLVALVAPAAGGMLYELDVRSHRHNLLATLARRPEAYHRKVLGGAGGEGASCASIHDRVHFKQPGLDQKLQYDHWPKKSLLDHFLSPGASPEALARGQAEELGDFVSGAYESKIRRSPGRVQLQLTRTGRTLDREFRLTKAITLVAGQPVLEIAYLLEGLPQDVALHLGIELHFAGLPAGADDRYFHTGQGQQLGQLGTRLDLADYRELHLTDEWLSLDVGLTFNRPTGLWTHPVETVSQSEGGFELVHQSVAVFPHWLLKPDAAGRWSVTFQLAARGTQEQADSREGSGFGVQGSGEEAEAAIGSAG